MPYLTEQRKEELLLNLLKELDKIVFVKSTNSVTGKEEELNPQINDYEAIIKINAEFDREDLKDVLAGLFVTELTQALTDKVEITEDTSDGYHTFKELYEYRKVYNALLFNEWSKQGLYQVHKSKKHADGEDCFGGGWFIVMATLPTGQISNHYELKDWDLFPCEERELADVWDGHTPQDVLSRLLALQLPTKEKCPVCECHFPGKVMEFNEEGILAERECGRCKGTGFLPTKDN